MACDLISLHSQQWFGQTPHCSSLYPSEVCNVSQLRFSHQQSAKVGSVLTGGAHVPSQDLQPFIPLANLPNWAWQQRTWVMGILNITPDSFSDGGQVGGSQGAIKHACHMVQQGADIIDVGGQSTRPGATRLTTQEEVQRVIPVIRCNAHCKLMHSLHLVPSLSATELSGLMYCGRDKSSSACLYCCAIAQNFRILHCGDAP